MRILHIGKFFPPAKGGMERFIADLVGAQRAKGDEVAVLVHAHEQQGSVGDPEWLMRCPVWMRLIFAPISPRFPFWLNRAIRKYRPDVLHLHMPNPSVFWGFLVPAARRLPWVVHWHADVVPSSMRLDLRLAYPHYRILERAVLESAECIIATSSEYLQASKPLAPWHYKCHVVPLGVDPARLPFVADSEPRGLWQPAGLRILAVGRLTYYKGFETLIRAVAGRPGQQMIIVGEGEERPRLERLLAQAGHPPQIRLLGELDDETVCRLMASCDVFCLPSLERTEAFGLVLVEAMRYAKPLLVSSIAGSGVCAVARDGQNAMLVKVGDVEAWREALSALEASPAKRAILGHLGFERYQREYMIAAVAERIRALYSLSLRLGSPAPAHRQPPDTPTTAKLAGTAAAAPASDRMLLVIPALNEGGRIGDVISRARAFPGIDICVVDDGSSDDTCAVALLHGATVLQAPLWQGAWGAIQTGIRRAVRHGYAGVITMDADGQHEPAYLPQMLAAARDADVVIAACPSRGSRLRQIAWAYFRFLTGFSFDDLTSGFRCYNTRACHLLASEEATLLDYQDIGVLLLLNAADLRIAEIAVEMNPRRDGASRVFSSWWTIARYMAETSLLCLARWNWAAHKAKRP